MNKLLYPILIVSLWLRIMVFEGFTAKYSKLNAVIKLVENRVSGFSISHAKGDHSDGEVLVH